MKYLSFAITSGLLQVLIKFQKSLEFEQIRKLFSAITIFENCHSLAWKSINTEKEFAQKQQKTSIP